MGGQQASRPVYSMVALAGGSGLKVMGNHKVVQDLSEMDLWNNHNHKGIFIKRFNNKDS